MSHQIITSELYLALSVEQQEIATGGTDFELANSNYDKRISFLRGLTNSGPNGSFANSVGISSSVNTSAQDFLGLGTPSLPTVGALGASPSGNDTTTSPETGSLSGS
ncbi:CTB family bacteriocin [Nostoc sp. FACHB-280]|uniref:CTB family bacteriocin n=1 Tax=Nostoc sp. FACHB-280 TaxID=2692839 RepID=UPI00168B6353|nr:CTB family bacteriocin [Nostoc sp. FACHB-280]MBD2495074.1 hypothetical protein [Nostoc sp. FACHB-280]